ncbi:MAG: fibronectin type III domain-containing protein, partial [Planctomycetes bacterium]|nr:fibronectin type III domain-containing protein [Planctomycetota bacterium]
MTRRNIVLMLLFVAFIGSIVVGASAKGCSNLFRRDEKDAGASGVIPQTPTGLTATAISSAQINLSWTDNDAYEQGFEIERKTGISGTYALVATVARNVTSYSNTTGLSAATAYYYRVRAYYVAPESKSAYSNEASATTPDTGWDMSFTL